MMPSCARASATAAGRGKFGRIFLSQVAIGAGIECSGVVWVELNRFISNAGSASKWISAKNSVSITIVVRRHFLSRPLRKIVASIGESM